MKIISFAYTTPALLAGAKTVTRREWNADYARRFREGELVQAYDRSPRGRGNHVATIRLTRAPSYEPLAWMPDGDYDAEGFAWLLSHPDCWPKTTEGISAAPVFRSQFARSGFERWRASGGSMWVVRFALVSLTPAGWEQLDRITPTRSAT